MIRYTTWMLLLACCIFALLSANEVHARIYYVARDGLNTNSGSNISSPFQTLERALEAVQAGDVIELRGGT